LVVEASAWLEDNRWILDLAKRYPVIRGFVGHLEPRAAFAGHLKRFASNLLFRGIRLGGDALRLESAAFIDDMRRLAGYGLALDVIGPAGMMERVAQLSERLPNLRIVIDHLPFDTPVPALVAIAPLPNVYAKISGSLRIDGIDECWKAFGADRLIYASNWPVSERLGSYVDRLAIVRRYFEAKPGDAAEKFFRGNGEKAYGLGP
jgi:L-fuconolactonase